MDALCNICLLLVKRLSTQSMKTRYVSKVIDVFKELVHVH